jgi:hypothetical protein
VEIAAAPPRPQQEGPERRASVRTTCRLEGVCRPLAGAGGSSWPAEIRDLSAGGVGLLLGRRFERGTNLLVEVRPRRREAQRTLLARVVPVEPSAGQGWSVGCQLTQGFSGEELMELLQ